MLANESVYDPASETWTATGKRNNKVLYGAAATLLSDGKVLAAGGTSSATRRPIRYGLGRGYDPVTGSCTAIANMQAKARGQGGRRSSPMARCWSWIQGFRIMREVYDPAIGT